MDSGDSGNEFQNTYANLCWLVVSLLLSVCLFASLFILVNLMQDSGLLGENIN